MVKYDIFYSKRASKEKRIVKQEGYHKKVQELLDVIAVNPYQNPPPYEKLKGNMQTMYSRRINVQHRLVYRVFENENKIIIVSMWLHY